MAIIPIRSEELVGVKENRKTLVICKYNKITVLEIVSNREEIKGKTFP